MATGRLPDPNSSPLTAKGDLYTYSTVPAKLAVGSNGETLVADSSATTGLRWQGNYAAGKNAIINGDFRINQRAFSSTTTTGTYGFDRWSLLANDGTTTYSAQTFTAGTAPVAGYEGINFARLVSTGQTSVNAYSILQQKIEDVRTFAGQTVTVSFWAKASSGTPKVAVNLWQDFGSGGSTGVYNYPSVVNQTISTSWARYSFTISSVASISGKTIGTGSNLTTYIWTSAGGTYNGQTGSMGIQSTTIDIWGVQVEAGSVATAFQTATGTLAGELAACQRYYSKSAQTATAPADGLGYSTNCVYQMNTTNSTSVLVTSAFFFPVNMRTAPTMTFYRSDLSSTAGKWGYYTGSWQNATTTVTAMLTDKAFAVEMGGTYTANNAYTIAGGWAASAEL